MTEAEWLACEKPEEMLQAIAKPGDERKWRLVVCSICRTAWPLLTDERHRTAVEAAERKADDWNAVRGKVYTKVWNDVADATNEMEAVDASKYEAASAVSSMMYASSGALTTGHVWNVFQHVARATGEARSYPLQAVLIRDIFGNPFRPVSFSPEWRTSTAVAIARGMYESREFGAMPILADALQDAGCDSGEVLDHCRGPGPHVRGCWVVDLVLGKG
jgi:hypothetical protein